MTQFILVFQIKVKPEYGDIHFKHLISVNFMIMDYL